MFTASLFIITCLLLIYLQVTHADEVIKPEYTLDITGGTTAKPHAFPYMVAIKIHRYNGSDEIENHCGGSLISNQYVLTAAHCFVRENYITDSVKVILGAHNLLSENETGRVIYISKEFTYNKNFNEQNHNDIALVKLPNPIKQTKEINLVRLPKRIDKFNTHIGKIANLTGWGKTADRDTKLSDELQVVHLKIVAPTVCEEKYQYPLKNMLCTAGQLKPVNKGACAGDSGGPLVIDGVVVGVVSYAHTFCETANSPTVFTRIDSFLDWIEKNSDIRSR